MCIRDRGVSKWTALSYLIDRFDLLPDEVCCFGDNLNDTNSPADPWYIVDAKNRKWAELQVLETLVKMCIRDSVGGVLSDYMIPLGEKVMAYNGFEHDVSYLKN